MDLRSVFLQSTPQSGSIASPLQLLTQCTPREKNLPQLPCTLGAQEMYQTQQDLMKRQGNKPEKSYIDLAPGTPVWVWHRQNPTWEPATVINQCAPNSYWSETVHKNSLENVSPDLVQLTLPRLDLPQAAFESVDREEITAE